MPEIRLRRVYDPPEPEADGLRVLVDRLWPRGLAKAAAGVRGRSCAGGFYDGGSAGEFRRRYEAELAEPEAVAELDRLRGLVGAGPVTLLTAVRDPDSSHAAILAERLSH
ncbi:hypothetical protein AVW11_31850 [Streptomyces amritsarensis]|uniref:DUF488 family protein n=1 Tax=Streptomyces amritsarensis TaxID=681158 RepID=A0ABX3FT30_9ACTN|nr:DUF488 family protein [Streptomyces amritsarensis]OLZ51615.1 hypothetical protein AVW11_31850 [Streptomyces amritsarensis]